MSSTAICWLRNDLRLHDNDPLLAALAHHERVAVFYYLDLRQFRLLPGPEIKKTGSFRLAFLLQSLTDLKQSLKHTGSDLIVRYGDDPAAAIKEVALGLEAVAIYASTEVGSEEQSVVAEVRAALGKECNVKLVWGKTLYHPDDLPFDADAIPEPFRNFRKPIEKEATVRPALDAPVSLLPIDYEAGEIPDAETLGLTAATPAYPGGETAALARLHHYLYGAHLLKNYRRTRNLSLGEDYSSKFSPYLALGCLSPRRLYAEVKAYGEQYKNYGGNSLLFEMRWRDYFIYLHRKHGDNIFLPGGFRERDHEWSHDHELFQNWCTGKTGVPFIDAHMRELKQTGFMSNRGRVNCASFLTHDYRIDWRWGAAWFENRLIDYEVSANWLNWHTQALEIYYTSAPWQGLKYDPKGEYVKTWLPELAALPAPLVHEPWKMEEEGLITAEMEFELGRDYPRPRTKNSKWDWAWNRIKTGDASSPKRKKKAKPKD